jgi:hypothetical protein
MIVLGAMEDEEVGDEGTKDHFFEPFELVHTVMGGALNGLEESVLGIIARETQQSPEQSRSSSASPSFQLPNVTGDGLTETEQLLFFGAASAGKRRLSAGRPMSGTGDVLRGSSDDFPVGGHQPRTVEDIDTILGFSYFERTGDEGVGNGITVAIHADEALGIDDAVVELVDLGDVKGKRPHLRSFAGEELPGRGSEMSSELGVGAVAELSGLSVEIGEVLESPPGKEVVFDEVHGTLDPGGAIGIADFVGLKVKAEALGESLHLGDRDHVFSRSPKDHHVGVVDQTAFADAGKVLERFGEEQLAVEPIEGGIVLEEQHAGITKDAGGGLNRSELSSDDGPVR